LVSEATIQTKEEAMKYMLRRAGGRGDTPGPRARGVWDSERIAEGRAVRDRALAPRGRGPYVPQGAIAALHADEPRDWPQIAALYDLLRRLGRLDEARAAYSRALELAHAEPERRFLEHRLAELGPRRRG